MDISTIPNETIVNWYYAIFILSCVLQAIILVSVLYTFATSKNRSVVTAVLKMIPAAIGIISSLFMYILATRTLGGKSK